MKLHAATLSACVIWLRLSLTLAYELEEPENALLHEDHDHGHEHEQDHHKHLRQGYGQTLYEWAENIFQRVSFTPQHHHDPERKCGVKDRTPEELAVAERKKDDALVLKEGLKKTLDKNIKVYWNVILSSSGEQQVTKSTIDKQITVLKNAFASGGWKFSLQSPVKTAVNDSWVNLDITTDMGWKKASEMKYALRKGTARDLNIYSTSLESGILGYATFPDWYAADPLDDGVVINFGTLPDGSISPYNKGDTLTHEVGHWMGLYHTFQGGCDKSLTGGDGVKDTPAVKKPNFECSKKVDSCPKSAGADLLTNYMDYVTDDCMNSFTSGQLSRMLDSFVAFRA